MANEKETVNSKEVDELFNTLSIEVIPPPNKKLSRIEKAGEQVMRHLMELIKTTDLTYSAIAKRLNETYGLTNENAITDDNIHYFLNTNSEKFAEISQQCAELSKIRAGLFLEHVGVLVKDIKILDSELDKLLGEDGNMIEPDKRAKAIGDLVDKKGRLLLRHARLSGKLKDGVGVNVDKMQVNIFNTDKSDIMKRLKKAEFSNDYMPGEKCEPKKKS